MDNDSAIEAAWRIAPRQALHFVGWEWENVLVFAEESGNTHQLSQLAAVILQILQDDARTAQQLLTELEHDWPSEEGADLSVALDKALRGLQRIGLIRQRRVRT